MLLPKEIDERRIRYSKICRYLFSVFENRYTGYELYELIDYDPSMPDDVKVWLDDEITYNFAEEKYKHMKLTRELKAMQKKIDKQNSKLHKATDKFFYN